MIDYKLFRVCDQQLSILHYLSGFILKFELQPFIVPRAKPCLGPISEHKNLGHGVAAHILMFNLKTNIFEDIFHK